MKIEQVATQFENESAESVIKWAVSEFKGKIAFANSLGAEDVVLMDMIAKINPDVFIFTLDTGRLPQETYDVWESLELRYKIKIHPVFPDREEVEKMVLEHGPNLFYKSLELRKLCCRVRKIAPLKRTLSAFDAWICGLRREQSVTRKDIKKVAIDIANNNIIKINPLADWTHEDVWNYIRTHNIPYNRLHDRNYPSIGCAPCTRAVQAGEDPRAGRWWWEHPETKECGLHKRDEQEI